MSHTEILKQKIRLAGFDFVFILENANHYCLIGSNDWF